LAFILGTSAGGVCLSINPYQLSGFANFMLSTFIAFFLGMASLAGKLSLNWMIKTVKNYVRKRSKNNYS
jgi:hypothetical protein